MSAEADEAMLECAMCGHAFTRDESVLCHDGCPMAKGCGLVSCPSCGYEFPGTSKVVSLITSLFKSKRAVPTPGAAR